MSNRSNRSNKKKPKKITNRPKRTKRKMNRSGGAPPKSGILKGAAEMFLGLNSEVSKNLDRKNVDRKNMRRIDERIKRKTNKGEDVSNSWLSYLNPFAYLPEELTGSDEKSQKNEGPEVINMDKPAQVSALLMDALTDGLNLNKQKRQRLKNFRDQVVIIAGDETKNFDERINLIKGLINNTTKYQLPILAESEIVETATPVASAPPSDEVKAVPDGGPLLTDEIKSPP